MKNAGYIALSRQMVLERQMEDATLLRCSEFGEAITANMTAEPVVAGTT